MTIEELRYFCAVAKYKNISRAAESLYISSSALSRHISSLETSLGVQLLARDGRSVDLTATGEYVFNRAPALIAAFDKFQDSVRQIHKEHSSTLVLACLPAYNRNLFNAFHLISKAAPEQRLLINPMQPYEIIDAVLRNETDVGITYSFEIQDCDMGVKALPLFRERFAVLFNTNHPLSKKESVTIEDLKQETLLTFYRPYAPNIDFLSRLAKGRASNEPNYALTTPSQTAMQVKLGNGIAVFPMSVCLEYGAGCVIVPIDDEDAVTDVIGIWRDDDVSEKHESFFKMLSTFLAPDTSVE